MSDTKTDAGAIPHWDMTSVYSGLDGEDYQTAFAQMQAALTGLETFCDENRIGGAGDDAVSATRDVGRLLESLVERLNEALKLSETLQSYVYAFVSTDSRNTQAAREESKLDREGTRLQKIASRTAKWIGRRSTVLETLIAASPLLESHAYFLRETARKSRYLMDEQLEALAAELCVDGASAFGRLQGTVTSQLSAPLEHNGKTEAVSISAIRAMSGSPDPQVRRRGYEAELAAWKSAESTVVACLNSVKGTAITLARRRGRESVLDAALDDACIDRDTLEALLGAIRESFPMFRRYLRLKSQRLGNERLPWWDLFAPMGAARTAFPWPQGRKFVTQNFSRFSGELADFAERAFEQRWIDAEPRDGKRLGGFCMPIVACDESRIALNYDGSFPRICTLAHELGHAYHNDCQTGLSPLQRGAPDTLAETASIFCETLVAEAALEKASPEDRLMVLEGRLCGATQACLDVSSRFLFESSFLKRREESELSADETCELMLAAQRETYGDAVDEATFHPYMWLWKPHYYSYGHNFYNFPYAFGLLFGLGLYAVYQREPDGFEPRYKELLRKTGQQRALPLAADFGIRIDQPEFWRESLRVIEKQVDQFEQLRV